MKKSWPRHYTELRISRNALNSIAFMLRSCHPGFASPSSPSSSSQGWRSAPRAKIGPLDFRFIESAPLIEFMGRVGVHFLLFYPGLEFKRIALSWSSVLLRWAGYFLFRTRAFRFFDEEPLYGTTHVIARIGIDAIYPVKYAGSH